MYLDMQVVLECCRRFSHLVPRDWWLCHLVCYILGIWQGGLRWYVTHTASN